MLTKVEDPFLAMAANLLDEAPAHALLATLRSRITAALAGAGFQAEDWSKPERTVAKGRACLWLTTLVSDPLTNELLRVELKLQMAIEPSTWRDERHQVLVAAVGRNQKGRDLCRVNFHSTGWPSRDVATSQDRMAHVLEQLVTAPALISDEQLTALAEKLSLALAPR